MSHVREACDPSLPLLSARCHRVGTRCLPPGYLIDERCQVQLLGVGLRSTATHKCPTDGLQANRQAARPIVLPSISGNARDLRQTTEAVLPRNSDNLDPSERWTNDSTAIPPGVPLILACPSSQIVKLGHRLHRPNQTKVREPESTGRGPGLESKIVAWNANSGQFARCIETPQRRRSRQHWP